MKVCIYLLLFLDYFRYIYGEDVAISGSGNIDVAEPKIYFDNNSTFQGDYEVEKHHNRKLQKRSSSKIVKFGAFGDTPHGDRERKHFPQRLQQIEARLDFLVHLGDIYERQKNCDTSRFDEAAKALKYYSRVPTFVIPGEADWYNCHDQETAWDDWSEKFLNFTNNWNHRFKVRHQEGRPENFAFNHNGVLFVSFHIISASVRDWKPWKKQVKDNVLWLHHEVVNNAFSDDVAAIVLMAHAKPHIRRYRLFHESLIQVTSHIEKPFLYLHTDEHEFQYEREFLVKNMLRVSVGHGGDENAMEITVEPSAEFPFLIKRKPIYQ
mmetsp:Transcript_41558/g.47232  ORF Transcript_41558/g.47232 Transcript_41558/m.47232 type:complete len:322 (-) Transcript_41558:4-969(-)